MNPVLLDIQAQLLQKVALVKEEDILLLKNTMRKIYLNPQDYFILHIGDCAEVFEDSEENTVLNKSKFYLEMASILQQQMQKEVVLLGRIAGQYAKPRTTDFEEKDGCILPSYRGDMINGFEFDAESRKTNPHRLLQSYESSSKTLKTLDKFYQGCPKPSQKIFTSHEALTLEYEKALTRNSSHSGQMFNYSAHTVWLGDRSRNLGSEHIDYLSTIDNPIGVKIGPGQSPESLVALLEKLNPKREEGKLYLITRLGSCSVKTYLPALINAVLAAKFPVIWCVDPMHGNTFKVQSGRKVRALIDIIHETISTFEIHKQSGSILSGLHLEATFLPVTECIDEKKINTSESYFSHYSTKCDPRLNPMQVRTLFKELHSVQ